jgi:hypothetical protein
MQPVYFRSESSTRSIVRLVRWIRRISVLAFLEVMVAGCGGGSGSIVMQPISVSLPVSTVVVPQDGTQVIVPILITSTSETARVSVTGLPTGVQERYAASDTNPSGSLFFTTSASTPEGIYAASVTVKSSERPHPRVLPWSSPQLLSREVFLAQKTLPRRGAWQSVREAGGAISEGQFPAELKDARG